MSSFGTGKQNEQIGLPSDLAGEFCPEASGHLSPSAITINRELAATWQVSDSSLGTQYLDVTTIYSIIISIWVLQL